MERILHIQDQHGNFSIWNTGYGHGHIDDVISFLWSAQTTSYQRPNSWIIGWLENIMRFVIRGPRSIERTVTRISWVLVNSPTKDNSSFVNQLSVTSTELGPAPWVNDCPESAINSRRRPPPDDTKNTLLASVNSLPCYQTKVHQCVVLSLMPFT